ncbi:phospholipid/cholesterol/gamma-HCH transport system substrate-binding protein [Haloechinothrix alba]|uniref:Phospholipid/cholesterol/gamma-HCH transport system substrate-binding protein n=1 Tax=Haloechinothrix alba TaxID=664784 RepID=A0A238ZLI3_9PSEU|nr:MlaD family protein [Haloechinothrix alba]SNR84170.1 phospholipid/cholesterol/gamma-HCH transport system substrate-binding protein [Haloechinothrix alba]
MSNKSPAIRISRFYASRRMAVALGVAVMVVFAAAVAFGLNATHGVPFKDRATVRAAFDDVQGLTEGDDVRIASTRVGYVEEITYEGGQAVVAMEIDDPDTVVYRDASVTAATVKARSSLGQKFVDIDPGSPEAGAIPDDDVITPESTKGAEDIGELFNVFDTRTREASGTALREVGGGLAGRSQDLHDALRTAPDLLTDLGAVAGTLSRDDGTDLVGLLRSAHTLAGRFEGREQEIANLTEQLATTMDSLGVDDAEPMDAVLDRAPETLREAGSALEALRAPLADTEVATAELRPGAESLGAATDDLRGVLREGVQPLEKVPAVADSAEPAVDDLSAVAADAGPLAGRLVDTAADSSHILSVLAPYSGEISGYFTNATSALSQGDDAGHWLRIYLVPRAESVAGTVPVEDPTVSRNAYPEPGEAEQDSASSPLEGGRR